MLKKLVAFVVLVIFISGCTPGSKSIKSAYVSPVNYQHFTCDQLKQEIKRVERKTRLLASAQDSEATKDAVVMGIGLVVFWPSLFLLIGEEHKGEISRLKGEYDALEFAEIDKECSKSEELKET
ncbi:MAG: hypothetical protein QNK24_01850, partial [Desulfuromusa sp.]|nr:hypothetical protein [Desulfuromusa sp.]